MSNERFMPGRLMVDNSHPSDAIVPMDAIVRPRIDNVYEEMLNHRGVPRKAAQQRPDQVHGRNPFQRPPVIIDATGRPPPGRPWGEVAREAVTGTARMATRVGKSMEQNAYQADVANDALDRQTGRWYVKFPWGTPMPLPKATDALEAANGLVGSMGNGLRAAGDGLLAWMGDGRPLVENGVSRSINKFTPLHGQSLVDDLVERNLDHDLGPRPDLQP